jgi:hypothetical protein
MHQSRAALLTAILICFVLAAPLRGAVIFEPAARYEQIAHLDVSFWLPVPAISLRGRSSSLPTASMDARRNPYF